MKPDPLMKSERWLEVDRVFAAALDLPAAERAAFLDEATADTELRHEVEQLLDIEEESRSFLRDPLGRLELAETLADVESGRRIGPYRLLHALGHGGMGSVYLALRDDEQYERRVAVKLIRRGFESAEVLHRFRNERQVLAQLEHPSIARLYDGGTTEDGRPFLVMEYVEGLPLDQYCDRRRLPVDQRLALFLELCAAVHHAHRNLLVHRDLKPGNVLVTRDGQVKLLDFGIAKLLDRRRYASAVRTTRTGMRLMSPAYASPEQVRGGTITTASDVYSLGVILCELLAGQSPYHLTSDLPLEIERAILEQEPERPSDALFRSRPQGGDDPGLTPAAVSRARDTTPGELRRRLRGDLDTLVQTALRKDPERRYGSARELAADIERYLTDRPLMARPDTLGYRLGKFVRRNSWAVAAGCVLTGLLVGISLITSLQSARVARQRDLAQQERIKAQQEKTKAQQVSDFLMELFEEMDPSRTQGARLTVREVLDRGTEKIEQLEEQPELQAAYMNTIGQVYRNLGLYDDAQPLLERALELRRRAHGNEHPEVAESLNDLAGLLQDESDYAAAEPLFRESLAMRRKLLGTDHVDLADSLNNLALLLYMKGEYDDAEPLYRESLAMMRQLVGDKHPDLATILNNLALLVDEKGRYEDAEALFRESLAMRRELLRAPHPELAISLNNLASLLHDQGDYQGAEALYQESLAMRRKIFGDEHPSVTTTMNNLALLLHDEGEYAAAEQLYRELLALDRKLLGAEHLSVAISSTGLAQLLRATGKSAEAERLLRQALSAFRRQLPESWQTAYVESLLGGCLTDLHRHPEAEALLLRSYPVLRSQLGEQAPKTRDALALIVDHYEKRQMPKMAADYRARASSPRPRN